MDATKKLSENIRDAEFREALRGYHREDVDQFLRELQAGAAELEDQLKPAEPNGSALEMTQGPDNSEIEAELLKARGAVQSMEARLAQVVKERDDIKAEQSRTAYELADARARILELEQQLRNFEGIQSPELITKALLKAQETAFEVEREAKDTAEALLDEAREQKQRLVDEALADVETMRSEAEAKIQSLTEQIAELESEHASHLRMLEALGRTLIRLGQGHARETRSFVDVSVEPVQDEPTESISATSSDTTNVDTVEDHQLPDEPDTPNVLVASEPQVERAAISPWIEQGTGGYPDDLRVDPRFVGVQPFANAEINDTELTHYSDEVQTEASDQDEQPAPAPRSLSEILGQADFTFEINEG